MRAANEKAPGVYGTEGFQKHTTNDLDSTADTANLIARLELQRHQVHRGSNGDFLVSKYGMSRYCPDVTDLQAFAKKLGVVHV